MKPELHPACAAFPPMPEEDLRALADDIKANGLIEPITMLDGQILDGRCRWEACEIAGVEPQTVVYDGDDPVRFVLAKNARRRHLSTFERADIAEQLAELAAHRPKLTLDKTRVSLTQDEAARAMNVSVGTVGDVRFLKRQAAPHVLEMVKQGAVGWHQAARAARSAPLSEQEKWTTPAAVKAVYKEHLDAVQGQREPDRTKVKPKAERRATIDIPYKAFTFPTAEETGFPTDGTMAEKDAFYERYGRTPIHPKTVRHLMESEGRTGGLVQAIISASNDSHPNPDQFIADIEHLLSWVPQMDKAPDYHIDFAAKARRRLAVLRERLPRAIRCLSALEAALRAYDAQRQSA